MGDGAACPRVPLADINGDGNSGDVVCTFWTRDFAYCRGIAQPVQGAGRAAARLSALGWGSLPPILPPRGIPDCAWWITGYDGPGMTQRQRTPLRGKNHSRVQLLDALCHGSIKPSSLAPLTESSPPSFPSLPRHLHLPSSSHPHSFPSRSATPWPLFHHHRAVVA